MTRPDDVTERSHDPRTGLARPAPPATSASEVDAVARRAAVAAAAVAGTPPAGRSAWLDALAAALTANADELVTLADAETALCVTRLGGELAKAAESLRFYAAVAAEGSWLGAVVDHRGPNPDLRRMNRPLGPVAVFGASNFPFGFGVLGHDTASALAAGCPVVVKAHPAHPLLSARLADLAQQALTEAAAPSGTFALVHGYEAGTTLVRHGSVTAVAFTGSERGGMALWRLACGRDTVIPVFAEMGTVNTVVVTQAAAAERADEIAAGFVASFTLGTGQFCTKPGLLLVPAGHDLVRRVGDACAADPAAPGWLLTESIAGSYEAGVQALLDSGAATVHRGAPATAGWGAAPTVLTVDADRLRAGSALLAECFGPAALVCEYTDAAQLSEILDALPGSLAAAVQSGADDPDVAGLVERLVDRAGRVVVDGWPTGVAVTWAQQHGGPWPATTVPSATSVGAAALARFVRPVSFQDVPDAALPPALQDDNPWSIPRRVDGRMSP